MLLPVSSYIAIRAEDHDDRAEKDRAKEDDDDKGAVNKLIRGEVAHVGNKNRFDEAAES